ncbi:MAG: ABC transporter permease subunit [Pirellulaceae bacterium]
MFGPVFNREAALVPKRSKTYLARTLYVLSMFMLLATGYLVLAGNRPLQTAGDSARFGGWMFGLLAPLQLIIVTFQSAVGAASNIAQEKDRRTLILLLLTRLSGYELVVGKLTASLVSVVQSLFAAIPLFLALLCFGGVSLEQFVNVYLVTTATAIFAASIGIVVALWRDKTFQTIAVTLLAIFLWVAVWQIVAAGLVDLIPAYWASYLSPVQAMQTAVSPLAIQSSVISAPLGFSLVTLLMSIGLAILGVLKVRVWNPSRELRIQQPAEAESATESSGSGATTWKVREARHVWNNPVLWREICTWAYGKKVLAIRFAYLLLVGLSAAGLYRAMFGDAPFTNLPPATLPLAAIGVVSLAIVNALAVNTITNERDGLALDLLLATDLEPKEFLLGKIVGVLFVAKEMVVLPLLLVGYVWVSGMLSTQNLAFTVIASLIVYLFVIVLGIHCGLNYANGRSGALDQFGDGLLSVLGYRDLYGHHGQLPGSISVAACSVLGDHSGRWCGFVGGVGKT